VSSAAIAAELIGRFVRGRERMDYRQLLARAGLRLEPAEPGRASLGAILLRDTDARVRLDGPPPPGSPAALAGLEQEEAIVRIGGRRIDSVTALKEALAVRRPGDRVAVEVEPATGKQRRTVSVRLVQEPALKIVRIEATGGPFGERERAFRAAWLAPSFAASAAGAAR
jgi:predicted metalloprotease with PDZ domain